MKAPRTAAGLALLGLAGVALGIWAVQEARRQRTEIEDALRDEASLLAASLAPGLAAASDAVREIDESIGESLLGDARLLAELGRESDPSSARLLAVAEANGLDTIAYLDAAGHARVGVGEPCGHDLVAALAAVLRGRVQEELLAPVAGVADDHRTAAVALERGGAVVVRVHVRTAYAFARRLGIHSLLERLVRAEQVLYLEYRETPGDVVARATWDGGDLPAPGASGALFGLRGRRVFEVSAPVEAPAGSRATLRVGLDGTAVERAWTAAARRTGVVGALLAGFGLASTAYALVRRQRDRDRAIASRRLAEAEEARLRSERLALAGALAAGLAHEVRSPLNSISLAAQRLERAHDDARARQFAGLVRSEVGRLDGVLREFLDLARPVSGRRQRVALEGVASEVLELLAAEAGAAGVELAPVAGSVQAWVEREAVRRALVNLVRNAIQASPAGGEVRVDVGSEENGDALLRVLDQGHGPDPELGDRVLEPFVTTRADGTGLGLALVRRVAEEHGGSFRLAARAPRGAEAVLRLPGRAPE